MAKKVLLVDDYDEFRTAVRRYLLSQGSEFEVFEAPSGELGIAAALARRPDIILMDLWLPEMHGADAARQIKKQLPACKIIVLTMFETDAFRKVFKSEFIDGYLGKSELYDKLLPLIEGLEKKRGAERELR